MRLFSKPRSVAPDDLTLRDDRLNFLIEKLGIGGSNAMNITWDDLANILVFLLEAEARRMGGDDRNPMNTGTQSRSKGKG